MTYIYTPRSRYTTGEHSLAHQEQRLTISGGTRFVAVLWLFVAVVRSFSLVFWTDGNITWHRRFVEQFPVSSTSNLPWLMISRAFPIDCL